MSKKVFTDQKVEMLRSKQYTYLVTPRKLLFTGIGYSLNSLSLSDCHEENLFEAE